MAAPNRDPARVRGTRAPRGWGSREDPHRDPSLSCGTAGVREGARKTRKGCPEAEPAQAPTERILCVSRRSQENPDRGRTALGCSKLCLRLPSGPWQQLPSADGTELASLSPGKQWPEETVSTWPRAPVSGPQPQSSATCPWPRHQARPLDLARLLEGQRSRPAAGPQRKVPQKDRPGRPVVSGPTWLQGAELLRNRGCESLSRPGDLQPGVTLPFPHPAPSCTTRGLRHSRRDIAACASTCP